MAVSHAVSALVKKHSEIQSEIHRLEQALEEMNENLDAVEISIKLFDSEYDLAGIRLKRFNKKVFGIKRGEIPKLVGDYVRLADKDFVQHDIVEYVFDQRPELDKYDREKIKISVVQALKRMAFRNRIVEVGRDSRAGNPIIWRSQI